MVDDHDLRCVLLNIVVFATNTTTAAEAALVVAAVNGLLTD